MRTPEQVGRRMAYQAGDRVMWAPSRVRFYRISRAKYNPIAYFLTMRLVAHVSGDTTSAHVAETGY